MSFFDKARDSVGMLGAAVEALLAIGGIARGLGREAERLGAISGIVDAIRDGFNGDKRPLEVAAEIDRLRTSLEDNDAAADTALDEKFRG